MISLATFVQKYPPAPPRRAPANNDEIRPLGSLDGVLDVGPAPAVLRVTGKPDDIAARHLWVIWPQGIPYLHEQAPHVQSPLASGVAKHTNLTGGAPASCGGELWVDPANPSKLYVNGASGRYGPKTPQQPDDAVALIQGLGFSVDSFGWDHDVNLPARVMR
ncbi:MAG: hypothetical protein U0324_33805 [Polyangiales bacterium]